MLIIMPKNIVIFKGRLNMNKNIIGDRITADKDKIIEMYSYFGMDIIELADEYNVLPMTMCNKLHHWGVKIRSGDYHKKREVIKQKMKISKELLAMRVYNTKINNGRVKFY